MGNKNQNKNIGFGPGPFFFNLGTPERQCVGEAQLTVPVCCFGCFGSDQSVRLAVCLLPSREDDIDQGGVFAITGTFVQCNPSDVPL